MDRTDWMPASMSVEDKAEFVSAATTTRVDPATGDTVTEVDDHLAAALAWEHYASLGAGAAEQVAPDIGTLTVGDKTITYTDSGTRQAAAMKRANWHRARAHVQSVRLGPVVTMEPLPARYVEAAGGDVA